MIQIYIKSLQF